MKAVILPISCTPFIWCVCFQVVLCWLALPGQSLSSDVDRKTISRKETFDSLRCCCLASLADSRGKRRERERRKDERNRDRKRRERERALVQRRWSAAAPPPSRWRRRWWSDTVESRMSRKEISYFSRICPQVLYCEASLPGWATEDIFHVLSFQMAVCRICQQICSGPNCQN